MYKDKDKQKEANRLAQKRFKDKQKGITSDRVLPQGITCFEQLPIDVQHAIDRISDDPADKAARTERAIRYQRLYPGNQHKGIDPICVEMIDLPDKPTNFGQPDCQCRHCMNTRSLGSRVMLNHGPHKTAGELGVNELNRVALPGDPDYEPPPKTGTIKARFNYIGRSKPYGP